MQNNLEKSGGELLLSQFWPISKWLVNFNTNDMKKFSIILMLVFASISLSAQSYNHSIEVSGGVGLEKYSKYSVGVSYQGGIQIKKFYAGLGVGFRYADALYYSSWDGTGIVSTSYESRDAKYLLPLNLRLKYNFTKTKVSPYLLVDGGYTFDVGKNPNKNIEGLFVQPQLGIDLKLKEGNALYFGVSANIQDYHYDFYSMSDYTGSDVTTKRFVIGTLLLHIGFAF